MLPQRRQLRGIGIERLSKLRTWRSRPLLLTFAVGAALGLFIAILLIIADGTFKVLMDPFLVILWPTSIIVMTDLGGPPEFTKFLIFISLISNALLYGSVFAALVGSAIAVRRSFGSPEKPPSIKKV